MPIWVHDRNNKGIYFSSEKLIHLCEEFRIPVYFDHNYMENYVPAKHVVRFLQIATATITLLTVDQRM